MLVTVALLGIALLPTGNQSWLNDGLYDMQTLGVPALCFFQGRNFNKQIFGLSTGIQGPSMMISILVLFFGYVTRMVKLWPEASGFTRRWLRVKPGDTIKKILRVSHARSKQSNANVCWTLNRLVFEMIYVSALAYLVILESMLWEVSHSTLQTVREIGA